MKLDETTLPVYAKGAAILGAGGGGSTRTGLLSALHAVEDKGPVEVISVDDVPDDDPDDVDERAGRRRSGCVGNSGV
jgi:uncharacterized protein